jgi:fatty-acyl-CoA synthase
MALPTLQEAAQRAAATSGGYRYLSEDGRRADPQPFTRLLEEALVVAGSLHAEGLEPWERVAIIVPDARPFLTTFIGASLAGLVPVPLYPPVRLDHFEAYLRATAPAIRVSHSAAILTTSQLRRVFGHLQAEAKSVRTVLAVEKLSGPALPKPVRSSLDDPVFFQFTSGSTSDPKGVVLTHRNLAENCHAIAGPHGLALSADDRGFSWLPLFHDMGLIGMALTVLYAGVSTTFISPLAFLKRPSVWLRAMASERATISFAPNFAYDLCVRRVRPDEVAGLDLSHWRVAGCGAEPVRASTLKAFAEKFASVGFREEAFLPCYGMAEHTLAVTFPPLNRVPRVDIVKGEALAVSRKAIPIDGADDEGVRTELVSCGRPFPKHEVRVADERGHAVPERHVGQILLKGPSVFHGYIGREAQSRDTLAHGWLHSGDLGYLVDGELYVCGRVKDTIIVNGRNYYPQDLEQSAADVADVKKGRVVAFGTGAAEGRERIVVVVESSTSSPRDDLAGRVRAGIVDATGVLVDEVVVAPPGTIPKTTSGKLQRVRVREQFEAGTLLKPKDKTSRARLVGHAVKTQFVYARSHASRLLSRRRKSEH